MRGKIVHKMSRYKLDFANILWEISPTGSRSKAFEIGGKKVRIVEIKREDEHAEWCQTGHIGFVMSGELEIEFRDETVKFKEGDGLAIPAGEDSEHRPRAISDKALLFLVEEV
jgi:quercetin dioxygenase-like cupin family protein